MKKKINIRLYIVLIGFLIYIGLCIGKVLKNWS